MATDMFDRPYDESIRLRTMKENIKQLNKVYEDKRNIGLGEEQMEGDAVIFFKKQNCK